MTRANVYLHKFKSNKNKHKKQDLTNKKNGKVARNIFLVVLWIRMQEITTLTVKHTSSGFRTWGTEIADGVFEAQPWIFLPVLEAPFFFTCFVWLDMTYSSFFLNQLK